MNHRSKAWIAIRAAARMRVLGHHAQRDREQLGMNSGVEGGSDGEGDLEQALLGSRQQPGDTERSGSTPRLAPLAVPPQAPVLPQPRQLQQQRSGRATPPHLLPPLSPSAAAAAARAPSAGDPSVSIHDAINGDSTAALMGEASRVVVAARRHPRGSSGAGQRTRPVTEPLASRPVTPLPPAAPWFKRDAVAIKDMIASSYFNILLILVPLGLASPWLGWSATAVFVLNFGALVPLALLLGDVTEDLALRFGDIIGGLLNATLGNVVEIILSITALTKGLYLVVATSLLGSILSNLLLVLGCCFFFGGIRFRTQTFNPTANQATRSLLFLSCIGIIVPTTATSLSGDGGAGQEWILELSRGTAVVMLIIYACYLIFQLHSHHDLFKGDGDDEEQPALTLVTAMGVLTVITITVAICSEYLTGAIEKFSERSGLSQAFIGIIILPIAGNACEHIVAVQVALKDKMDLALGVAVGSSIQIALFALPLAVVVGWGLGCPFTLDFDAFSVIALTVSVLHANFTMSSAASNWLMGAQLLATYALIALAAGVRGSGTTAGMAPLGPS